MTLTELRTHLADALAPLGVTTYTHIPARMSLPGAFIAAGSPYIEQGQTFGERLVRFEVVLATQTGDNLSENSSLDELIENAQALLDTAGWQVEEVSQPYIQEFANAPSLVTQFTVSTFETFN